MGEAESRDCEESKTQHLFGLAYKCWLSRAVSTEPNWVIVWPQTWLASTSTRPNCMISSGLSLTTETNYDRDNLSTRESVPTLNLRYYLVLTRLVSFPCLQDFAFYLFMTIKRYWSGAVSTIGRSTSYMCNINNHKFSHKTTCLSYIMSTTCPVNCQSNNHQAQL